MKMKLEWITRNSEEGGDHRQDDDNDRRHAKDEAMIDNGYSEDDRC